MSLRDYQAAAALGIEEQWTTHTSTMAVLPTGTGKTVLFAEMIRRRRAAGRAMVIAHREELIWQAEEKIRQFAGLECGIEMGERTASSTFFDDGQDVVLASVQSLISGRPQRRMERFKPAEFATIIIDEFHHATAASYRAVLDYFLRGNPGIKVLGVTATPDRGDEEALGQVCESVAFDYQMVDAIEDGWLCPVEQQMVTIAGLDFSAVRTTAGDLNGADLAAVMEAESNLQGLCAATLDIVGARQTIVFTTSVHHAEMACAIFNRHKLGIADWVCGATEKEKRRTTMSNVVSGKTQILCNVGVATEGFDAPRVEVIVMGRPTKSRALYAQMAGRATRPLAGIVDGLATADERRQAIAASAKRSCLLVDFCGNSGRHKLMTGMDLLGGKYSEEVRALAETIIDRDGRRYIQGALEEAEEELAAERREAAERRRQQEEARKARLVAKATYSARGVNPFDAFDVRPEADDRAYDGKSLSEKQRSILIKMGIDPDALSYCNGKRIIDEQFRRWDLGLCTAKQAAVLNKFGYDGANTTMADARRLIDAIAANGWRRPAGPPRGPVVSNQ